MGRIYTGEAIVDLTDGSSAVAAEASLREVNERVGDNTYVGWHGTLRVWRPATLYNQLGSSVRIRFADGVATEASLDAFRSLGTVEVYELHGRGPVPFA